MACKEREDNVPYFIEKLGEVPISIDYGEKGIWNNCKDSWLLHQNKDWHIVLQDDSIIPPDFNKHIEDLIRKIGDQDYIISLYVGARLKNKIRVALNMGKDFVTHYSILNENALMMRTKHINQMINYCDSRKATTDRYIQTFARKKGLLVYYPVPSLIQHRADGSVYRKKYNKPLPDSVRQAVWYIEDSKPTL